MLTTQQALFIQQQVVKATGGSVGVRDTGLLEGSLARPFASFGGEDLYPTIFLKAASLLHSVIKNHPFVDGNKRTALGLVYLFLKENSLILSLSQREAVAFPIQVATDKLSLEKIAEYLEKNTRKVSQ